MVPLPNILQTRWAGALAGLQRGVYCPTAFSRNVKTGNPLLSGVNNYSLNIWSFP